MTSQQPTDGEQYREETDTVTDGSEVATAGTDTANDGADPDMDGGVHRPAPDASYRTWTTGEKYGVGTTCDHGSDSSPSRVWFTLTEGSLTEPRFPRVDTMQYRLVDFLVTHPESGYTARTHNQTRTDDDVESIERSTSHSEKNALVYRQEIRETGQNGHEWTLDVEYITSPHEESLLFDVEFAAGDGREYDIYLIAEAAVNGFIEGTGGRRIERGDGFALGAWDTGEYDPTYRDGEVATAIATEQSFSLATATNYRSSQLQALLEDGTVVENENTVGEDGEDETGDNNNRVLVGQLETAATHCSETVAIGFAENGSVESALEQARESLDRGFDSVHDAYVAGWESYMAERPIPDAVAGDCTLERQYRVAIMVLRAVEDKTYRGASVASPSVPWGDNVDATAPRDYGYNFTWSRDLYQVFTALLAVDDIESARQSVEYLYEYQQEPDGFLPQNTYLDGRPRWDGEQLDNIAFPSVMAYQLLHSEGIDFDEACYEYADVRRSAEYLLRNGPRSEQERWEEEDGFSPSTIAAVVAGLGCAGALAARQGERADAICYLAHADRWRLAVDEWCATTTPQDSERPTPYYLRVSDDGETDSETTRELANNGPALDEREIIDAGFLELVRLGLRRPDESVIENSLEVVDETIRVDTPNGPAWYRYNGDGYGELGAVEPEEGGPWSMEKNGSGRLWPILNGERGEYELLAGTENGPLAPSSLLKSMANFANSGRMIPEQIWDREGATAYNWEFGEGTGAATPLAWSMAQFVRLAHAIDAGEPVETPRFLARRYREIQPDSPSLVVRDVTRDGEQVSVEGETDGDELVVWMPSRTERLESDDTQFEFTVDSETEQLTVIAADGSDDIAEAGTEMKQITW